MCILVVDLTLVWHPRSLKSSILGGKIGVWSLSVLPSPKKQTGKFSLGVEINLGTSLVATTGTRH